jgi:uncharacterized membrane protein
MAKGFPIKMRARMTGKRDDSSNKKGSYSKLRKLERLEKELESVSERVHVEINELEKIEGLEEKPQFAWIKGNVSHLMLQDVIGAAFGAIFFVVTQEVWDLSAKFVAWQIASLIAVTFLMGYALIFFSRRRKNLSKKVYHNVFFRCFEMYLMSFAVSASFILMIGTAPLEIMPLVQQASLVTVPAMLSAATADLLFY